MKTALPLGITRNEHCRPDVTLVDCHAIRFYFDGPRQVSVIVWRDGPKYIRPVRKRQRISELQLGDYILYKGRQERIGGVEIYR